MTKQTEDDSWAAMMLRTQQVAYRRGLIDGWESRGKQDAEGIRDTKELDDIAKQKAVRVIRAQDEDIEQWCEYEAVSERPKEMDDE